MTLIEYSLQVETEFKRFLNAVSVPRQEFQYHPTEAIQNGFSYLLADNILSKEDVCVLCAEYDFGDATLDELLTDPTAKERIMELLNQLEAWYKKDN